MKYLNRSLIIAGIIFAIINRVVIPFGNVFTDYGIILNTPDAYYMVRMADMLPDSGIDYFSVYPFGTESLKQIVWPLCIKTVAIMTGSNISAAAILPPVVFALTLGATYILASGLFNQTIATISVFIACILPGEILTRTMLGAGDYHCLEMLLMASIIASIIIMSRENMSNTGRILLSIIAVSLIALYCMAWPGAAIIFLIIGLAILAWAYLKYIRRLKVIYRAAFLIAIISGLSAIAWKFLPHSLAYTFFTNTDSNITECFPFFFTAGQFDITTMMAYYGLTFYLILFGIGWLTYRAISRRQFKDILFLSYSLTTLGMMLIYRRFDYYFAISGAIITAFIIYELCQILGKQQAVRIAIVFLAVISLPLIKQSIVVSSLNYAAPSRDWVNTCEYLKSQNTGQHEASYYNGSKPDYGAFSWWNYGYWLIAIGHQAVYSHGGTADNGCSDILLSEPTSALERLKSLNMQYVVIDDDMFKFRSLQADDMADTFMYQAYYNQVNSLIPKYQSGRVKVFEVQQ